MAAKKRSSGLLRQIGVAAAIVVAIVAMWFLLNPQGQREGFEGLTLEEREALQAQREQKRKEKQAAEEAALEAQEEEVGKEEEVQG